jgi:sporulation protein YlmC with PRC-barrel domain
MKQHRQKNYRALCGAVAAISISLIPLASPLYAQDSSAASDAAKVGKAVNTFASKTLGHVERAGKLIGKEVIGTDGQRLGKIDNLIVDLGSGRILYGVVGTGGFLGVEEQHFAVPPGAFTQTEGDTLQINADKAKLLAAPRFTAEIDKPEMMAQPPFLTQVYQYFGQNAWWQNAAIPAESTFANVHRASSLIGMKVENTANERIGKVQDLGTDLAAGRVVYVILSPGTILEPGDNLYALPPTAVTWNADRKSLVCDITKDKLNAAPHFARDNWTDLSNAAFASQVYQYYGKEPYFETRGAIRPTGRSSDAQPAPSPKNQSP